MTPVSCTQYAYLYLARNHEPAGPPPYSDHDLDRMAFDPDQVTALVGLTPTRAHRRGDPSRRPGAPAHRFSNWTYGLPEVDTFDTEEVVTALLDAIEPYAAGITRARHTLGLRAGVMVVISTMGAPDHAVSTPAVCYRAQTVQRLAGLHLSVEHDQYVDFPG